MRCGRVTSDIWSGSVCEDNVAASRPLFVVVTSIGCCVKNESVFVHWAVTDISNGAFVTFMNESSCTRSWDGPWTGVNAHERLVPNICFMRTLTTKETVVSASLMPVAARLMLDEKSSRNMFGGSKNRSPPVFFCLQGFHVVHKVLNGHTWRETALSRNGFQVRPRQVIRGTNHGRVGRRASFMTLFLWGFVSRVFVRASCYTTGHDRPTAHEIDVPRAPWEPTLSSTMNEWWTFTNERSWAFVRETFHILRALFSAFIKSEQARPFIMDIHLRRNASARERRLLTSTEHPWASMRSVSWASTNQNQGKWRTARGQKGPNKVVFMQRA